METSRVKFPWLGHRKLRQRVTAKSPISFLGSTTLILNNVRHIGSNSPPRQYRRLEPGLRPTPNSAHSFFVHFESRLTCRARCSSPTAFGQQMTWPIWAGAYSCLSFDHSVGFT